MITFFAAAAVLAITVRVCGLRPMPVALAASMIGLAVNVFGLLPVPPTPRPLDAAANAVSYYQRGQTKSLICHLRIYDAIDAREEQIATAEHACAAAEAHWASRAGRELD
jgi:hypothetical protein